MILTLKNLGKCRRCGSANTKTEILIPSIRHSEQLRGSNGMYTAEIFCQKCGKINRTEVEVEIQ